ncbi:DUF11 domain-containing protein [Sphingomonas lacunae]|uniref:DUF11 domain-containing protein n=1 Tax=Sphingomonas lacunae TaxID=2698828 RepID=A0A6M4AUR2_9SPHN|nr:DUF11 domain-containing protein [Sphingomonas lacunae]QJQ32887.1 DUF11 domain-containing protein [Sphingomonas lacunae]
MTPNAFVRPERTLSTFAILCAGVAAFAVPQTAMASGTRAGTVINNTAQASYDSGGSTVTVDSNTHSMTVAELINTTVVWDDSADVGTTPGATTQILTFQVTNTGNGEETFSLAANGGIGGDNYDPAVNLIVIDDGDGVYEPSQDLVYTGAAQNPTLDPDESITVFIISTTPAGVADGARGGVKLTAASTTGTGAPGTTIAGAGEGGSDAVLGTSGGDSDDDGFYLVSSATVSLLKSATVLDPFGGNDAVPGATITYSIVATTTGSGSLPNLVINDSVPTGTTYVAGSIRLGGTTLTDATGDDAGRFSSNAISVALGTVPGGETRTVSFQVTIN